MSLPLSPAACERSGFPSDSVYVYYKLHRRKAYTQFTDRNSLSSLSTRGCPTFLRKVTIASEIIHCILHHFVLRMLRRVTRRLGPYPTRIRPRSVGPPTAIHPKPWKCPNAARKDHLRLVKGPPACRGLSGTSGASKQSVYRIESGWSCNGCIISDMKLQCTMK